MKVREYRLLCHAIEQGIGYGYRRAHKHVDHPTEDQVTQAIYEAVTNELCEWFTFDPEHPDDN